MLINIPNINIHYHISLRNHVNNSDTVCGLAEPTEVDTSLEEGR